MSCKLRKEMLRGYIGQCFPKCVPQNPSLLRWLMTKKFCGQISLENCIFTLPQEINFAYLHIKAFRSPRVRKSLMVDPISSLQIANPPFFLFLSSELWFCSKDNGPTPGNESSYLYDNYRTYDLLCQVCTCDSVLLINETSFGGSGNKKEIQGECAFFLTFPCFLLVREVVCRNMTPGAMTVILWPWGQRQEMPMWCLILQSNKA